MSTREHQQRKRFPDAEQREGLRKSTKIRSGEVSCPVCDVTLWPGTLGQHYQQELEKLSNTTPSLAHTKKKRKRSLSTGNGEGRKLFQQAYQVLESVKRHRILHTTPHEACLSPGTSSSVAGPSTHMCPVCSELLPSEEGAAQVHVNECLGTRSRVGGGADGGSSDDDIYEEYTWCNVTRVRATSMLTPEARANMFGGTVISKGDVSLAGEVVDVEEDETDVYGPAQYPNTIATVAERLSEDDAKFCERKLDTPVEVKINLQCLICMDSYHVPLVSIKCWHVYCEECWLQALRTKKLCPKCKNITSSTDLRKIFL